MIGLGMDTVDVERFTEVLQRRRTMSDRLFTASERAYAEGLKNPYPSLAARFAAKEAVMKALSVGLGAFDFAEVEVVRLPSGAPELRLSGRAAELAESKGVGAWRVSLTHTDTVAAAVVAALEDGG